MEQNLTSKRKVVDWEAIDPIWKAGVRTKKWISDTFDVSRAALDKHYGNLGIERDLADKIRHQAETIVTHDRIDDSVTPLKNVTEEQIIEANARAIADVIRSHRKRVWKAQKVVDDLLKELVGKRKTAEGDEEQEPLTAIAKASVLQKATESLKTLIMLERQSYRMDVEEIPKQPERELSDEEVQAEIRRLTEKANG